MVLAQTKNWIAGFIFKLKGFFLMLLLFLLRGSTLSTISTTDVSKHLSLRVSHCFLPIPTYLLLYNVYSYSIHSINVVRLCSFIFVLHMYILEPLSYTDVVCVWECMFSLVLCTYANRWHSLLGSSRPRLQLFAMMPAMRSNENKE